MRTSEFSPKQPLRLSTQVNCNAANPSAFVMVAVAGLTGSALMARETSKQRRQALGRIADALREAGYTSLDAQAKALGLPRSTAYTIIKCQHKMGRLSKSVLAKMLSHSDLPKRVRAVLQEYASETLETDTMKEGRSSRTA
jgi:hypothetical protein